MGEVDFGYGRSLVRLVGVALRALLGSAAALVLLGAFGASPTAHASTVCYEANGCSVTSPSSAYKRFAGCPTPSESRGVRTCYRVVLTGRLELGSLEIPISRAVVLSGGVTGIEKFVFNGRGGLTRAAQVVPAGLIGLTGLPWLGEFLSPKEQAVVAVLETPAGTTQASTAAGTELRVHLVNPTLGAHCYIGTSTDPIPVDLEGSAEAAPGIPDERGITREDVEVIDESLAVPAPSGCVLNLFGFVPVSINGLIDAQSSLSTETGSAELSIEREMVPRSRVYG